MAKTRQQTIGILGGTGFVGQHLCSALISKGYQIKVFSRRPAAHKNLLVLPECEVVKVDVMEQSQLKQAVQGCDAIINLVGILNESGHNGLGFYNVHVDLVHRLIFACKENHVKRILHVSSLNADKNQGPSHYLRTKGDADALLLAAQNNDFNVTIFRPSVIFGPGDTFLSRFEHLLKISPIFFALPLAQSIYSPIYVGDLVDAMVMSLDDSKTYGQIFEVSGPKVYSLLELLRIVAKTAQLKRVIIPLGTTLSRIAAKIMEYMPGKPLSMDNFLSASIPSVPHKGNALVDFFQIAPRSLESMLSESIGPNKFKSEFQKIYQHRAERMIRG